ncbi:P-loop containing nucleoside triphosphate hydrolase protein [Rickenella mellea]|uniref:P-loop containing nucleoside triphosphate hydrolase protein n=1 Tax=Rickenella mellea TaxID=50990 RepID=A0A4Y7PRX4_9AGAM|nr:P-loop containing nucleoside triphosphate hydrolase protein [Rickenella mellea]
MSNSKNKVVEPPREVTIAVMGATGVGKSSFINMASQSNLKEGRSLHSCTQDVQIANQFELDGITVTIIDTPGFDDTSRSDSDILKLIAAHLEASYKSGYILSGIIYMHRISDPRMTGINVRNFSMFLKLCGDSTLKNVIICTTMWDTVSPEEGADRELELETDFFKPVLDMQGHLVRHSPRTSSTAQDIIRRIIKNQPGVLQIQKELVDDNLGIDETTAGTELNKELLEQAAKHREEMRKVEEDRERAIKENNKMMEDILTKERQKLKDEAERKEREVAEMKEDYIAQKNSVETKLRELEEKARADQARVEADYQRKMENLMVELGKANMSKTEEEVKKLKEEIAELKKKQGQKKGKCVIQ